MPKKLFALVAFVALSCLFLVGCGEDAEERATARLRVLHASPDAPNVDVYVDGSSVLTNVAYKSFSEYLTVTEGDHRIQVRAAGTSTPNVIDASPNFARNSDYTVIAVDYLNRISPVLLTDNNTPPAAGNIKLRVVHGAPSAPPVDVYVTAPDADLATATPTLSNVPFKTVSEYLSVPAGTYRARVTVAGTKTVAIDSGSLTLNSGQIRTAVAVESTNGGAPFSFVVLPDAN